MALNPIVYTEKVVRSFLRYQLTAYPVGAINWIEPQSRPEQNLHGISTISFRSK
ncbi:MAG: hypothetical protein KAY24_10015 [Candidatus Eisenbacteria sp.]|nr:hypothetical protein [Candidatus Eisenbacteria bacterium]